MDKNKTYRHFNVSAEHFVLTWQLAETTDEVAERLKMPKNVVISRACNYRRKGIRLKRMESPPNTLDTAALNRLISDHPGKQR